MSDDDRWWCLFDNVKAFDVVEKTSSVPSIGCTRTKWCPSSGYQQGRVGRLSCNRVCVFHDQDHIHIERLPLFISELFYPEPGPPSDQSRHRSSYPRTATDIRHNGVPDKLVIFSTCQPSYCVATGDASLPRQLWVHSGSEFGLFCLWKTCSQSRGHGAYLYGACL